MAVQEKGKEARVGWKEGKQRIYTVGSWKNVDVEVLQKGAPAQPLPTFLTYEDCKILSDSEALYCILGEDAHIDMGGVTSDAHAKADSWRYYLLPSNANKTQGFTMPKLPPLVPCTFIVSHPSRLGPHTFQWELSSEHHSQDYVPGP